MSILWGIENEGFPRLPIDYSKPMADNTGLRKCAACDLFTAIF